jgi:hypothetical protein
VIFSTFSFKESFPSWANFALVKLDFFGFGPGFATVFWPFTKVCFSFGPFIKVCFVLVPFIKVCFVLGPFIKVCFLLVCLRIPAFITFLGAIASANFHYPGDKLEPQQQET